MITTFLLILEKLKSKNIEYIYSMKLKCLNCLIFRRYNIPRGMSVNKFGRTTDCLNCGLKLGKEQK